MNTSATIAPFRLSTLQAVTLANIACSVPSLVMSAVERSLIPWVTFIVLVQIHAVLLGLPALKLISSLKAGGGVMSAIMGTLIGVLPTAIILSKASGPGLHYGQSIAITALSGAAVGLSSWLLLARARNKSQAHHAAQIKNDNKPQAIQKSTNLRTTAGNPYVISNPRIGFLNLAGDAEKLLAHRDFAEIGSGFLIAGSVESEKIPKCNVLFLYCSLEPSGRISGQPYSLRDIIRATGAHIAVVASEISTGVVTSSEFSSFLQSKNDWPANIVITLNRNGDSFGRFFKKLFSEMHAGKTMPSAWVKLSPQGPAGHADNPGTVALLEAGHIAFSAAPDASHT